LTAATAERPAVRPRTRRDAITLAGDALRDIYERLSPDLQGVFAEVYSAWDGRLAAARDLRSDYPLSEASSAAVDDLAHAHLRVKDADLDELLEWLDLLPRNILAIVDVTPTLSGTWPQPLAATHWDHWANRRCDWATEWGARPPASRKKAAVA